jgi:hypothetical protein
MDDDTFGEDLAADRGDIRHSARNQSSSPLALPARP